MPTPTSIPPPQQDSSLQRVQQAFHTMEAHPRWTRLWWLYVIPCLISCMMATGPMTFQEMGSIPLGVAFLASLTVVWPVLKCWIRQPLVIAIIVWGLWTLLSLTWSLDPHKGLWEASSMRFLGPLFALWPAMRHRRKLVWALAFGFAAGNASQLVLWLAHALGTDLKPWDPRNPGWWTHPAEAGYILVGALGLHLPAALMGTGRTRHIAIGGCIVTWLGMLATGSRGAWIAGAALMAVAAALAVASGRWRWQNLRWKSRTVGWAALVVAIVAGTGWLSLGDFISKRAHQGIAEIEGAVHRGQYENDTGARIKFAKWGLEMFEQKPLLGWGAGSYEKWVDTKLRADGIDPTTVRTGGSTHNTWLHTGATLGAIGLLIALAITWLSLRGGFQGIWRDRLGTYDAGPGMALIGMILTTPFDVPYVNSVPADVICVLFALCLLHQPEGITTETQRHREGH